MSFSKRRSPAADGEGDAKAQNALQSDFNATDDGDSMDADERYLVRLSES